MTYSFTYYIIPSDNWEQQLYSQLPMEFYIISYQAITGNNNVLTFFWCDFTIISYQAITGNNNVPSVCLYTIFIISYQAITGNNNY